jgi:hypothetical protein
LFEKCGLGPKGERFIWLEPRFVDRLAVLRGTGESFSDVILRMALGPLPAPIRPPRKPPIRCL